MKKLIVFSVIFALLLNIANLFAQIKSMQPVYVLKMPISDYTLFATGGWDGNWYVGSNQAWIEKINLSKYNRSDFKKAYIGAKLGRMKSEPAPSRPAWIRKPYPGSIYCAIASTPVWKPNDYILLTPTEDIPLQYDYENAIKEVGESRWFWAEVPIEKLNFSGDNYVILWSPDEYLNSASSAPILAAAWGTKDVDSWLVTSINPSGKPFLIKEYESPLKTPITIFEPAIALKLIPANYDDKLNDGAIEIISFEEVSPSIPIKKLTVSINGISNVENVWLEAARNSQDKNWQKISRYLYYPPYIFSLDPREIPFQGKIFIRAACRDIYGKERFSQGDFSVEISTTSGRNK